MTPTEHVLGKLHNVKETGAGQWQAHCPAHDDKHASLCVTVGEDGQTLLYCDAGCDVRAVVEALGLRMSDLFRKSEEGAKSSPEQRKNRSRVVARYPYVDEHGTLLYEVVRQEPKRFTQRQPDGRGGWIWNMQGVTRIPYNLPNVLAAIKADSYIFIVEGEKDVQSLAKIKCVGTCNAGGAGKWLDSYSEHLRGAHVIIIPDNDVPGCEHAMQVACSLHQTASSVKYVLLPDLPPKGDVSDWLKNHTPEEFFSVVESSARRWVPDCIIEPSADAKNAAKKTVRRVTTEVGSALSDLSNAERLIAANGEDLRYDVNRGAWLIWNGKRWEYDQTSEIDRLAMKVVRTMYSLLKTASQEEGRKLFDHIKKSESQPRLAAMVTLAAKLPGVTVQAKDLDR